MTEDQVLKPYRLRTAKVAFQATILAIVALIVYPMLSGAGEIWMGPYAALLAVGIIGATGFYMLPWERLLDHRHGMWVFYAWSFLDILLITLLVGVSGGARSDIYILYALTTVFLAASYPPKGQLGLIAVTFALYLAVVSIVGGPVSTASVFLRLATIGSLGIMGNFLSRELMQQMKEHVSARHESLQRALLMSTVTRAAWTMTFNTKHVFSDVVDAARALGFEAAGVCVVGESRRTFTMAQASGIPEEFLEQPIPASNGIIGRVLAEQRPIGGEEGPAEQSGPPSEYGLSAATAAPIFSTGEVTAVLLAGYRLGGAITPAQKEALELLAAQAGAAMDNARRFEDQRIAAERLAELDRLKQDFIATMSHELRTPLTVIKGMAKTLRSRWRSMEQSMIDEFLERVDQHSDNLDSTITTLLDFSKLQSGDLKPDVAPTNVEACVRAVVSRLDPLFHGRPLSTHIEKGTLVIADEHLLGVVLENLLSNAAKHTPKGTRVSLSARTISDQVQIEVCDDGPGIDPREARELVKEFYRGGEVDTRSTRGTGIGLALTREILKLHGTELVVARLRPHGLSFSFRLPLDGSAQVGPNTRGQDTAYSSPDSSLTD